ncbi:MAG: outer membrane beta-barrel protein, partial [Bacteroidota bacterium]
TSSSENVTGSFGKGFGFGLGLGYMFTENIGAEASFSMLFGSKIKTTYSNDLGTSGNDEIKSSIMRITPALKVTGGEKLKPYAKFGLVVGVGAKGTETLNLNGVGFTYKETDKYSGGTSIGWMGAFGVDFELSEMLGIYVELNSINQTWAPEKNDWSITQSGVISESESGTQTFVDKISGTQSSSTIFHVDNQALKSYNPFSSFGIQIGAKLSFGGSN